MGGRQLVLCLLVGAHENNLKFKSKGKKSKWGRDGGVGVDKCTIYIAGKFHGDALAMYTLIHYTFCYGRLPQYTVTRLTVFLWFVSKMNDKIKRN